MKNDLEYFTRRAAEERGAAMASSHERVRACHLELAAAYDRRVKDLQKPRSERPELHVVTAA
jgi:hypothetical protein